MAVKQISVPGNEFIWIDLQNPDEKEYRDIAQKYNLNIYTLSDSLEPNHLPKFEELNDLNFLIVRMSNDSKELNTISIQSISNKIAVYYNNHFLITIHRVNIPFLDDIFSKFIETSKITQPVGIVIKILWNVLHTYEKPLIENSEQVDKFEAEMFLKKANPKILTQLYYLKARVGLSRKIITLTDEVISSIKPEKIYKPAYQDVKDLKTKLLVLHEQILEEINNLQNVYLSLSNQKTSDIMKTLTIFSIFFMPLTFIVGVYGMNFKFMPELNYKWGYPLVMISMVAICLILYIWFKRKKWL